MKERKQKRDRFPPRVFGVRGFDHSNQRGRARWGSNNNRDNNTNNDNGGPSRDPGRQSAQAVGLILEVPVREAEDMVHVGGAATVAQAQDTAGYNVTIVESWDK